MHVTTGTTPPAWQRTKGGDRVRVTVKSVGKNGETASITRTFGGASDPVKVMQQIASTLSQGIPNEVRTGVTR